MNLLQFLESKYVSTNLELQEEFTLFKQAETKAGQNIINFQRRLFIWAAYLKLMFQFGLMKAGLNEAPLPAGEIAKEIAKRKALKQEEKAQASEAPPNVTAISDKT